MGGCKGRGRCCERREPERGEIERSARYRQQGGNARRERAGDHDRRRHRAASNLAALSRLQTRAVFRCAVCCDPLNVTFPYNRMGHFIQHFVGYPIWPRANAAVFDGVYRRLTAQVEIVRDPRRDGENSAGLANANLQLAILQRCNCNPTAFHDVSFEGRCVMMAVLPSAPVTSDRSDVAISIAIHKAKPEFAILHFFEGSGDPVISAFGKDNLAHRLSALISNLCAGYLLPYQTEVVFSIANGRSSHRLLSEMMFIPSSCTPTSTS